jgi:hypothetical protein
VEIEIQAALNQPTSEDDTHPSAADRFRLVRRVRGAGSHSSDSTMVWDLFQDREPDDGIDHADRPVHDRRGSPAADSAVPTFKEVDL